MGIKLKCFLKKHWHHIILGIYFILLVYQHSFIHMYGDDYYYGTFLKDNFFKKHIEHYMVINGRALVHFVVSLMLYFETKLFMIVNPLMIIGVITLVAKLVTNDKEDYKIAIVSGIVLFSMLSINITRQSVFWLDGSFNYLFPMLLALATIYLLKKSIYTGRTYWYLPVLGLLAGMTVEQATAITFGGVLLVLLSSKFINNKKLRFNHYLTLGLSFLGGLTVVLAPGTFMRAEIEGTNISVIGNLRKITDMLFLYKDMQAYNLMLLICVIFWLSLGKDKKFLSKVLFALNVFFFVLILKIGGNYTTIIPIDITNKLISVVVLLGILTFLIGLIYLALYNLIIEKNDIVLISLILAIGAQIMMIISPVYGYRILLCTIILYFIPIIATLIKFKENQFIWWLVALMLSIYMLNTKLILICTGLIIFEYINNQYNSSLWIKKLNSVIVVLLIVAITSISNWNNINGYKINHDAHMYNKMAIQQYLKNGSPSNEDIILKQMPLYDYGWSYPYVNPYHMKVMKMYYGIDQEVNIEYEPYN